MLPRAISITTRPGRKLQITFTNGEIGIYDCEPLLDFGVFKELRDESYFRQACIVNGTVAWPHEQDICPDTLYLESHRQQATPGEDVCGIVRDSPA